MAVSARDEPIQLSKHAARRPRRIPLEQVPFHRPSIGEREIAAAVEVLRSGWLTTGSRALAFEEAFAERIGVRYALAVNSATSALHLALEAFGIQRISLVNGTYLQRAESTYEVTMPTLTFAACGAVAAHLGARPDLTDVGEDGLLGPEQLSRHIISGSHVPRVVMPVHYGGLSADIEGLRRAAPGLRMVEDAAHSIPVPLRADAAAYSFYATKAMTTGEGGMLVTDDDEVYRRAKMMRLHGISSDAWDRYAVGGSWRYSVEEAGYKYNLTDLSAAIGLVQLDRVDELAQSRANIAACYDSGLQGLVRLPPRNGPHSWHLYIIRVDPEIRDLVIQRLAQKGIGTSVHFIPLHLQPLYRRWGYHAGQFPVAEKLYRESISLPIWPDMSDEQVERVIEGVKEAL